MSKISRPILLVFAASIQILHLFNNSYSQDVKARITIGSGGKLVVHVEGDLSHTELANKRNLSFLRQFGGSGGLGDRVSVTSLTSASGDNVSFRKLIPGEYLADADITGFSYDVAVVPSGQQATDAHVSWIGADRGILMPGDLLPQFAGERPRAARLTIDVPSGWGVITSEHEITKGVFDVANVEKSVFVVAKQGIARTVAVSGTPVRMAILGAWQFTDAEASAMAADIYGQYKKLFGGDPSESSQVVIMRFPGDPAADSWEADTRGQSVTVLSADSPIVDISRQRLHQQLRHEIFHLWVPNGLDLSGNYDWFYEGFALYQSLKLGVAVNQIRFDDMLGAIANAYNVDSSQAGRMSLVEASKNRWNGQNARVYARGLLLAFLCDLALMEESGGKRSTANLLRAIYDKFHTSPLTDGNAAIIAEFRSMPETGMLVDKYINGADAIDWSSQLSAAGIQISGSSGSIRLTVIDKPDKRQAILLDKLGYNSWRKLTEKH